MIDLSPPDIRTVQLSPSITAQGVFVKSLPDGRIVIKDGNQPYVGYEVK